MNKAIASILVISILGLMTTAGFLAYHLWKDYRAGASSKLIVQELTELINTAEVIEPDGESSAEPSPLMQLYGESYMGLISIPSLSLELPINKELTDANLESSPCRYVGDISSSLIISGHDYRSHFGNLKTISEEEMVFITDMQGNKHQYVVKLMELIHETDIDGMINNPFDLTLFTCASDYSERLAVRCLKVTAVHDGSINNEADSSGDENLTSTEPDAPNYKINYREETIRLQQGDLYSKNSGESYIEIRQTGYTYLDVSDLITKGMPIYIKRGATTRSPESEAQVIVPAPRAVLDSFILAPENGKLTLDNRYEVYDGRMWRSLPKITSDTKFSIRTKSTAQASDDYMTGYAASLHGTLIIKFGEYEPGKKGIISAEVVKP